MKALVSLAVALALAACSRPLLSNQTLPAPQVTYAAPVYQPLQEAADPGFAAGGPEMVEGIADDEPLAEEPPYDSTGLSDPYPYADARAGQTYDPAPYVDPVVPAEPWTSPLAEPVVAVEPWEPWTSPNEEIVFVDDWYEDSTTVEYWTDDGGAYYGGFYYPGAIFVAGTWNDGYFPYHGCTVPGGVLLRVDRPRDVRIPWRAYRGHAGRSATGTSVLEDRRILRDRAHRGIVQVRRRTVPVQVRPAAPSERRIPRLVDRRTIQPATSRVASAYAARTQAQRAAAGNARSQVAEESRRRARSEQAARETRERNDREQAQRAAAGNARNQAAEETRRRVRSEQAARETRERNDREQAQRVSAGNARNQAAEETRRRARTEQAARETRERNDREQAQRAAAGNARKQATEEARRRARDEGQQRSRVEQDARRREAAERRDREKEQQSGRSGGRARR